MIKKVPCVSRALSFDFDFTVLMTLVLFLGGTDGLRGASVGAGAAIDTSLGVDDVLSVAFRDSLVGAFINTSSALDAIVSNNVSHFFLN